jgi:hypothetical protein
MGFGPTKIRPLRRLFTLDATVIHRYQPNFRPQSNRKPAAPHKKQQRDESILDSIEESSLWRWRTAFWSHHRRGRGNFVIQVRVYAPAAP